MDDRILHELKAINSLSVNTALWVFRMSFDNIYPVASKLPLEQIDEWVKSLDDHNLEQDWVRQKCMRHPHLFLYGMLWYYKDDILRSNLYQRERSENGHIPNSKKDYGKHKPIVKNLTEYILPLPFYEGIAFLGKLIGAWMLTCPETIIRSENNVEKVGEWQVRRKTTDWEVPQTWVRNIYPDNPTTKARDKEMQLLFVLDFLLHFAFDDYDTGNT